MIIKDNIINDLASCIDFSQFSKVIVLTDENVAKYYKLNFESIIIFAGEKNKNLETTSKIWKSMNDFGMDRKSLLINFGGGVVCDLGGFCASTYMRGIKFINIPTTLLSQVDASVGGKTGFDFNGVKNLVGTFAEPYQVIIDTSVLKTLPKREYVSGLAEVIKYGIIYDKIFFKYLLNEKIENKYIIEKSCETKTKIVESDFRDNEIRKILNFGHTIGHGVESLSLKTNNPLLHGEAVSIGMLGETYIAWKIGYITQDELNLVKEILIKYSLPIKYEGNLEEIYSILLKDKKNSFNKIKLVLPQHLGKCLFDVEVEESIIKEGINFILS
ncbi:MAG: 3-dehydroquinate synthase [Rickettsiales bacterium]|nr:3-dehydroquinate synthase [Rickettsiales bacterium]